MTAASEAPELLLQHHLKKLRLPTVLREYEPGFPMWHPSAKLSVARNRSKASSMGCATKIMPDNTKLRVNGTWWHSILPVGPCLGWSDPLKVVQIC